MDRAARESLTTVRSQKKRLNSLPGPKSEPGLRKVKSGDRRIPIGREKGGVRYQLAE